MQKEFVVLNFKRFRAYLVGNAPLERLHTGFMWAEGPVYFTDMGVLLFSDVPGEKIFRYVEGKRRPCSGSLPATRTATRATAKDDF